MLQMLTFCYNCTVHETTGFVPFYLMFGRVPRLPVDIMFHHVLEDANVVSHSEFVHHLKRDLTEAVQIAQQHAFGEQTRHAKIYNRKVRGLPLAVGDRVLLANQGERGKRKVADRWDSTPFDVVSVRSGINVYRIRDGVTGREKVVHRNMLLPVDFLTFSEQDGHQAVSGEPQSDAQCGSAQSSILGDREDTQARTMNWLIQSPVEAEAGSESVPEGDDFDDTLQVDAIEKGQSEELPDSVSADSEHSHIIHAHTDPSSDPACDTAHLPVDVLVALRLSQRR